ncbi:MAG: hypothetical protein NZ990_07780 [Myxococcota bacterium]|nr:hypothetical protein [Myxococcota bacterium]
MKTLLKILLTLALAVALFLVAVRFKDGPLAIIAGGPLTSGNLVASEGVDFSFAKDMDTIELQLLEPPRSRTTWIIFHDGHLYVPAGFMDLPIWKQWPHEAVDDGRAVARIEGVRYPFHLERVEDRRTWQKVRMLSGRKYGLRDWDSEKEPGPEEWNLVWIFRLNPQSLEGS